MNSEEMINKGGWLSQPSSAAKKWIRMLCIVASSLIPLGCSEDGSRGGPTGPDDHTTPPSKTQVTFSYVSGAPRVEIYLDEDDLGSLSASNTQLCKEISPGSHHYVAKHVASGFSSDPVSFAVSEGQNRNIPINPGELDFHVPKPTGVSATDGSYSDHIRVSWHAVSASQAPTYEVYRNGQHLGSTEGTTYDDHTASTFVTYEYTVRATWSGIESDRSSSTTGYRKAGKFLDTEVRIDNAKDRVYIYSDLDLWGYREACLDIAAYWFRKVGTRYLYQRSCCGSKAPGNYLGHRWSLTPGYSQTEYNDLYAWLSYGCFCDHSGYYYGMIKLYTRCGVTDPNASEVCRTAYVSIQWRSAGMGVGAGQEGPVVRVLTNAEARALEADVEGTGGLGDAPEGSPTDRGCPWEEGSGASEEVFGVPSRSADDE